MVSSRVLGVLTKWVCFKRTGSHAAAVSTINEKRKSITSSPAVVPQKTQPVPETPHSDYCAGWIFGDRLRDTCGSQPEMAESFEKPQLSRTHGAVRAEDARTARTGQRSKPMEVPVRLRKPANASTLAPKI